MIGSSITALFPLLSRSEQYSSSRYEVIPWFGPPIMTFCGTGLLFQDCPPPLFSPGSFCCDGSDGLASGTPAPLTYAGMFRFLRMFGLDRFVPCPDRFSKSTDGSARVSEGTRVTAFW